MKEDNVWELNAVLNEIEHYLFYGYVTPVQILPISALLSLAKTYKSVATAKRVLELIKEGLPKGSEADNFQLSLPLQEL